MLVSGTGAFEMTRRAATPSRVVQDLADLERYAEAFERLEAQAASPMQAYAWTRACAETFCESTALRVVLVGDASGIAAVAPLGRRTDVLDRLELVGMHELNEPQEFLFSDASALARLAEALVALRMPLILDRLPADSPVPAALQRAYRGGGFVVCRPANGWPYVTLDDSWRQPDQHLNAGRRSDLRRARRTLEKTGPVTFDGLSPAPGELGPLLDEAFRVEAASWKGREGSALARDANRGPFYRRYAEAASEKGILRLSFLRVDGQAAAMQLAVESGQGLWILKIGYDERFARGSPGILLTMEALRHAAERGLRTYEFLGTVEPWIRLWTDQVRPCITLRAYPANMRGMAAFTADASLYTLSRAARLIGAT
jgi:CelD/BcsL family acetyltransferase involved in cellulose biosynthesis